MHGRCCYGREVHARIHRLGTRVNGYRSQISRVERKRRDGMLQHPRSRLRSAPPGSIVPDKTPAPGDVAIATRLLAAHRRATESAPAEPGDAAGNRDVWTVIAERQGRFASILERDDAEELAAYLCNVSRHDASHGITQGEGEYRRIVVDGAYRGFLLTMAWDKLVSLAEAVGAIPVENPEQGAYGEPPSQTPAELVDLISLRIGISIEPPDVDGGLLKLATGRGRFGERDANAIYTAWLMRAITDGRGELPRVCEIGGGSGRVAYWSHRLGLVSYTIVDLPMVNVVQGYYALKNLPGDAVSLFGEAPVGATPGRLQILPPHAIAELTEPVFDVVLNQDSFPEMHAGTVAEYLTWIRTCCAGRLVSINHESEPPGVEGQSQVNVPEAIARAGGFAHERRSPYWLRRGYVVESYRVGA